MKDKSQSSKLSGIIKILKDMRQLIVFAGFVFALLLTSQSAALDRKGFEKLIRQVAEGLNEGNAKKAADCFSSDAIFSSPDFNAAKVKGFVHQGKDAIYKFFGGDSGRPERANLVWQSWGFDETNQTGFGEYTYRYGAYQGHGVAMIHVKNKAISNWRDYKFEFYSNWHEFLGTNQSVMKDSAGKKIDGTEFRKLIDTWIAGWAENDAGKASGCFTEDTFTLKPQYDKEGKVTVHYGPGGRAAMLKALTEFAEAKKKRGFTTSMEWHTVAFDKELQIGVGEYTFHFDKEPYHGVMVLRINDGLISREHEYEYDSKVEWDDFIGVNKF